MTALYSSALALLVLFVLFPGLAMGQELQWRDAGSFEIEGRGWANTAGPYDRLPDSAKDKVNPHVWDLSKDSAGICARFTTDAASISVRWSLTREALDMPHMPSTGVSGVDLYTRAADGAWRFIGNGAPHQVDANLVTFIFPDGAKPQRECLLYFPLYNGVKSIEIGAPQDAHLDKPAPRPEGKSKPVVVYGTSIVQGGCASRPGMAWTAILGRLLDRPVINLGFSGSATMEPPVGEPLAELDPAAYVIDCTWNTQAGPDVYLERITQLVHAIRKAHPDTPMIFVGQSLIRPEAHPTEYTRNQEAAVKNLQNEGIKGLFLVPGTDLIGYDGEGTVDGCHPNDLGMNRQAHCLFPIIRQALSEPVKSLVYIDTDTANELDDPYAIFRALSAPEFSVVGLSSMSWGGIPDFAEGMRKSQKMNEDILALMGLTDQIAHPQGALTPMPDPSTPVDSPAARDIIAKAKETPDGQKLHVFVLGAYTNIASAMLLEPSIKDKIMVRVIGFNYIDGQIQPNEFNAHGDLNASASLLKSGAELHIMPTSSLRDFKWAKADVEAHFKGKGGVPDYLVKRWDEHCPNDATRILWDVAVIEAFLRPNLAVEENFEQDGFSIHVWTSVDVQGMQADYWEAVKTE